MVKEFKIRGEAYRTASIQGGNGEMDWEGVEGMYLMIRWMHWMGAGRRGQFVLCGLRKGGELQSCRVEPLPSSAAMQGAKAQQGH